MDSGLDEAKARTDKWKGRAQSGERQVDKLHQVLQNIAKLLHVHGCDVMLPLTSSVPISCSCGCICAVRVRQLWRPSRRS